MSKQIIRPERIQHRIQLAKSQSLEFLHKAQKSEGSDKRLYTNCSLQLQARKAELEYVLKEYTETVPETITNESLQLIIDLSRIPVALLHQANIEHFIQRAKKIVDQYGR